MINLDISAKAIPAFCERHHVRKLSLFGSVLRGDFRPESDLDVLIEFEPGKAVDYFTFFDMQVELTEMFGREVDLNTPNSLSRHFRNKVVESAQVLYERAG